MEGFEGLGRRGGYFEEWYCKFTGPGGDIAFIPGMYRTKTGERRAFIQLITRRESRWFDYPFQDAYFSPSRFFVQIGKNRFFRQGAQIDLTQGDFFCRGALHYGPLLPGPDVMGLLRRWPFLQCRYDLLSLDHAVEGELYFPDGPAFYTRGYLSKNNGRAFPKKYLWAQCQELSAHGAAICMAAAVSVMGMAFTGFFARVLLAGRELLLASWRGGRVDTAGPAGAVVRQGEWMLVVQRGEGGKGQPLRRSGRGGMERLANSSVAAPVRFQLIRGRQVVLDIISERAGFEAAGWGKEKKDRT